MKFLNLGCGTNYHRDWVNIDFVAHTPEIIKHDLREGIPCPDASFDVVYHSHVLEHFSKESGAQFMRECYRVLKPQGLIRVVVPDLEQIIRTYLLALEKALKGDQRWQSYYDWILLELFDQATRNQTGGEMVRYFSQPNLPNLDFIVQRIGAEARSIAAMAQAQQNAANPPSTPGGWKAKTRYRLWQLREFFYRLLLRSDYNALQIGRFRQSGEIHYQMYDQFSLKQLLIECGFDQIMLCTAQQSQIPNWSTINLDVEPDGSIYKPDSLFMEAKKP